MPQKGFAFNPSQGSNPIASQVQNEQDIREILSIHLKGQIQLQGPSSKVPLLGFSISGLR
jgi:hypothetical protein